LQTKLTHSINNITDTDLKEF